MFVVIASLIVAALLVESAVILTEGSKLGRCLVFTASVLTGAFLPWAVGKAWLGMVRDIRNILSA